MAKRQLAIDEQRYEALKLRAKALRISEEELLRRAIDRALAAPEGSPSDPRQALAEFIETARQAREGGVGAEPYRFCRDDIYEEREARLSRSE